MIYLGRQPLGGTVHVFLRTKDEVGTPSLPEDAPRLVVFDSAGDQVLNTRMPILDRRQLTGLFHLPVFLGHQFSAGHYSVEMNYQVDTHFGLEQAEFEVLAHGHTDGHILAMHFFRRPHADFLVWQTESGKIKKGKNPYL